MKKLLHTCLVFILPLFLYSQENKSTINFLKIEYSDLSKIILTDHYNDNFERTWGRVYEIEFSKDSILLFQTREYYYPYQFVTSSLDSLKMFLLSEHEIDSTEIEKIISEVNKRNTKRSIMQCYIDSTYWGSTNMLENWSEKRFIKNISKVEIEKLLNQINARHNSPFKYLKVNGIDSIWLKKNSERLIDMLSNGSKKQKPYWTAFYKDLFTDYDNFKWKYAFSLLRRNMDSYPYFEMQMVTRSSDTICINSEGQDLYQIPWTMNGEYKTYNPLLPISISNLIPEEECCSSKNRLNPSWSEIETNIIDWIKFKNYKIDKKKWRKIASEKRNNCKKIRR
ncbi:hypothetical protein GCQ56_18505 [Marinifilum sp. N1E240]|uniref:hypothetical protein n=1 Tax=Marinifilum sp. N1E240 TaxID=2608082 RepID=UPI00128E5FD0|nr:hypothetical protein [Marinifilum sp. N1E240]MPQ48993.1 hypothetical protein [Marinifilum sp. N1E240]